MVPPTRYGDDGEMPGTSQQSLAVVNGRQVKVNILRMESDPELANHLLRFNSSSKSNTEQQQIQANTNAGLYFTNRELAHMCVFCKTPYECIASHYKKQHPGNKARGTSTIKFRISFLIRDDLH